MTPRPNKLITLATVAMLVLVLACGTEEDQDANQQGVAAVATPTPTGVIEETPISFPFPVVELVVGDMRYPATQGGYCWPDAMDGDVIVTLCADMALDWQLDERTPIPVGVQPVIEIDYSDPAISLFANFYRDPQIRSEVDLFDIIVEEDRTLDLSAYLTEDVYLRISGQWPQGSADFLFRIQPIPSGAALTAECGATEAEPLPLEYQVLNDPTPTGFDGRNHGSCTFNKPVARIIVGLNNGPQGSFHTQTFHFAEPLLEVSFPLKEWGQSVKTLELLPPGPYTRTMVAETADGEQWDITDNVSAALDEVTVILSEEPTPMPPREWDIEDVSVDGSTVTVTVRVYATADYTVLIDGIASDETQLSLPLIQHIFKNVASGTHELTVSDVVGHVEGQVIEVPFLGGPSRDPLTY